MLYYILHYNKSNQLEINVREFVEETIGTNKFRINYVCKSKKKKQNPKLIRLNKCINM